MPYTNPRFIPSNHGFQFANYFKNFIIQNPFTNLPLPFGISFTTGGRCGGMIQAALDYFLSDQTIPNVTGLPPDGDSLGDYILKRQYDSFYTIGPEVLMAAAIPRIAKIWHQHTIPSGGAYFSSLINKINDNQPCPIVCIPGGYNLTNLGTGHQVLVIGYSDDETELFIYDPNTPKKESILRYENNSWITYTKVSQNVESPGSVYYAWFPDLDYSIIDPRNIFDIGSIKDKSNKDLSKWKPPKNQDLRKYIFRSAIFRGNNKIANCEFEGVDARSADFSGCPLIKCDMQKMLLDFALLNSADLSGSTLAYSDLHLTKLQNITCNKTNFNYIKAEQTNFSSASMKETNFKNASLSFANFSNAVLNNVDFTNATLEGSNLSASFQSTCKFGNCPASGSKWIGSTLNDVTFEKADLSHASFSQANINSSTFRNTILHMAQFIQAKIINVSFEKVNLEGAQLIQANLDNVIFSNVSGWETSNWNGAILNECEYDNPRVLSHILSQGATLV